MEFRISDQNLPSRDELEKRVGRLKHYLSKVQSRIQKKRESIRKEVEKIPDNKREQIEAGLKWLKETDNQSGVYKNSTPPEE